MRIRDHINISGKGVDAFTNSTSLYNKSVWKSVCAENLYVANLNNILSLKWFKTTSYRLPVYSLYLQSANVGIYAVTLEEGKVEKITAKTIKILVMK